MAIDSVNNAKVSPYSAVPVPVAPAVPPAPAPGRSKDALTLSGKAPACGVPYINQLRPTGADRTYVNGFSNCGPTSMSMVARAFGRCKDVQDPHLIMHMGRLGGTTGKGSSPESIVKMAEGVGLAATIRGPGPDLDWIDRQLKAGQLVVAHGNYFGLPQHSKEPRTWAGGHFLVVAGRSADGGYVLRDPLDEKVGTVSREDLARFIQSHPSRGHQISIGEPKIKAKTGTSLSK
jgi:hypothetical protein